MRSDPVGSPSPGSPSPRLARGEANGVPTVPAARRSEGDFDLCERDHPERAFASFGDALVWAFATVLALQGDPVPASTGARLAMLVGFGFGLVIVASLAGAIGAYLVDERRERATREEEALSPRERE
jgi:hypothetical protein